MTKLDDFLGPLHQGVWEVVVPKQDVTEPLDESWKKSEINVPSPEMVASYRKGQYHTHETKEEWKTHMDRYDPETNPGMHLVDDAPLVLMLWGTINSLFLTGKDSTKGKRMDRLAAMDMTWKVRMAIGAAIVAIGLILILFPLKFAEFAFSVLMPLAVMGFGALTLYNGYRMDQGGKLAQRDMALGVGIIAFGVALIFLWKYLVLLILFVLAMWFFASAFVSIRRSLKGKAAVPEGFWVRMAMAMLSLALGIMTLFVPKTTVGVLIILLGIVVLLVGGLFLLDGYGLRNAHKLMKEKPGLYD